MKTIVRTLSLIIVLLCFCACSACAEEMYVDSSDRIPDLYEEIVYTFDEYFNLTLPSDWAVAELSESDIANGVLAYIGDNFENPGLTLTVSIYTPEECTGIFGGTGYDAIFACLQNMESVTSANVNGVWVMAYQKRQDDHEVYIANMTTANGYMYQIRFDLYDPDFTDYMYNIMFSLEYT